MGVLDEAIRDHLELRRRHGASDAEIARSEAEALGPARRDPAADIFAEGDAGAAGEETTILDPVSEGDVGRPLVGDFPPAGPVDTEGETAVYNLEHDIRDAPVEEAPGEEPPGAFEPITRVRRHGGFRRFCGTKAALQRGLARTPTPFALSEGRRRLAPRAQPVIWM